MRSPSPGKMRDRGFNEAANVVFVEGIFVINTSNPNATYYVENETAFANSTAETNSWTNDLIENPYLRYTLCAVMILIMIFAVVGNICLIKYVSTHRRFRNNATGFLILNLAICDLINAGIYQPMSVVDILLPFSPGYRVVELGHTYCQVTGFFLSFIQAVAFHTIVAISQERLLLISSPFKAKQWLRTKRLVLILLLIWVIAFLAVVPIPVLFAFEVTVPVQGANLTFCASLDTENHAGSRAYFTILFALYYVLPAVVVSATYGRIFCILYRDVPGEQSSDIHRQKTLQARKTLAKKMLAIAGLFACCNGPYFITYLYVIMGGEIKNNPLFLMMILEQLPVVSCAMNPVIYSGRCKKGVSRKAMFSFLSRTRSTMSSGGSEERKPNTEATVDSPEAKKEHWITMGKPTGGDVRL